MLRKANRFEKPLPTPGPEDTQPPSPTVHDVTVTPLSVVTPRPPRTQGAHLLRHSITRPIDLPPVTATSHAVNATISPLPTSADTGGRSDNTSFTSQLKAGAGAPTAQVSVAAIRTSNSAGVSDDHSRVISAVCPIAW